ncbi:hypothetical protein BC332_19308 [Capsicum chinense]|nr:hypothetical protein BC332_19308 [Capsicum chinense]
MPINTPSKRTNVLSILYGIEMSIRDTFSSLFLLARLYICERLHESILDLTLKKLPGVVKNYMGFKLRWKTYINAFSSASRFPSFLNKCLNILLVCPTVGVGGHFSGGGYRMMSRKFGIAADNIIDAKLIDANGKIQDRESMGEDLFWAIRGGGGTSFGLIVSWKVKLLDIPEKVTVFNVERTLEQNATQLVYKWQHITDKVDYNLFLRLFVSSESPFRRGQRTINAFFNTKFIGEVDELLHEMQKSFLELGLVKEDCIEMSWIESVVFFARNSRGTPIDVLLNLNTTTKTGSIFKGKSDYVQ